MPDKPARVLGHSICSVSFVPHSLQVVTAKQVHHLIPRPIDPVSHTAKSCLLEIRRVLPVCQIVPKRDPAILIDFR